MSHRLLLLAGLVAPTAAQSGVVGAGLCRNMFYQVPWDTLDYEGVIPSEFACSSACVQTAEQMGVPGTCAGYAYRPALSGAPSSCAVYYGITDAPTHSTTGNMISFFANPKDPEIARVPVFDDRFYTCHVYSPPPPSPPPPAREWPNGACRPNAQQCPGVLKSRSEAGGDYCGPHSHGWGVSARRDDDSCSCCSGDEAECGGTASYCTGADVHQCFEYATPAGFNVSETAGLGLASANVACAWEPAGAPSAWNGTHALSRTLYKEWPFTYSYPRQQMSGSGSTVGRPWVLQNADGSLPTVQTKCDVEPDPANGYVASPDNCARCPFLFDEACTRYLGNPYAWPGLEPNPMGGADWASAEYRAWVQNSAGYFDDPGHTILNDGVVAETILPNNTVLTGISEHWLEQHPTQVEVSATRPSRPPAPSPTAHRPRLRRRASHRPPPPAAGDGPGPPGRRRPPLHVLTDDRAHPPRPRLAAAHPGDPDLVREAGRARRVGHRHQQRAARRQRLHGVYQPDVDDRRRCDAPRTHTAHTPHTTPRNRTAPSSPPLALPAGTNDPALFDAATLNLERSGKVMGDELYYNRVVGGVDGSRSGACNVPPGAVCVCVGNTKVAMFPQYEPGVYATNHTVSIHTGAEGASDYRPEWPAVQYIQVMMVWPGYPCTPLLDTGAETLDGKFIQVHCGGIALSEIKVFVDDDRQPFDVTWVDANYYGGGGSGTPACTEPHLEARAPTTRPARRRRRRGRAHRPAAASLVTPDCARGPPHRSLPPRPRPLTPRATLYRRATRGTVRGRW